MDLRTARSPPRRAHRPFGLPQGHRAPRSPRRRQPRRGRREGTQEVFGKGNYYLELMDHTPERGRRGRGRAADRARAADPRGTPRGLAQDRNPAGGGTNDSHYAAPEDAGAHDLRLCISVNRAVSDPKRLKFDSGPVLLQDLAADGNALRGLPGGVSGTPWRSPSRSRTTTWWKDGTSSPTSRRPRARPCPSISNRAPGAGSPPGSNHRRSTASGRRPPTTTTGWRWNSK